MLRLLVAPLLLWLLALPLIDLPDAYLLLAAMPCGDQRRCWWRTSTGSTRRAAAMIAWSTTLVLAAVSSSCSARA